MSSIKWWIAGNTKIRLVTNSFLAVLMVTVWGHIQDARSNLVVSEKLWVSMEANVTSGWAKFLNLIQTLRPHQIQKPYDAYTTMVATDG